MAWAYASLAFRVDPLLDALSAAAIPLRTEASPQHIANTSWAFATLAWANMPGLDALASAAIPPRSDYEFRSIGNTAWSLATLCERHHRRLMEALSTESLAREEEEM